MGLQYHFVILLSTGPGAAVAGLLPWRSYISGIMGRLGKKNGGIALVAVLAGGGSAGALTPRAGAVSDPPPRACSVAALDWDGRHTDLPAKDPSCKAAERLFPLFVKLREAAGIGGDEVGFAVLDSDPLLRNGELGAYYFFNVHAIVMNRPFLNRDDPSFSLYAMAHEMGHAVQDQQGTMPNGDPAHSRRFEGQADAIAQQILARAGYDSGAFKAVQERWAGCLNIRRDAGPAPKHPQAMDRWRNLMLATPHVEREVAPSVLKRVVEVQSAVDGANSGGLGRLFEGGAQGGGEAVPRPTFVTAPRGPLKPIFNLEDFDSNGRLLPGRVSVAGMRVPSIPAPNSVVPQVVQGAAAAVTDWVLDVFQEAVNARAVDAQIVAAATRACDVPNGADKGFEHDGALALAADLTARVLHALIPRSSPSPNPAEPTRRGVSGRTL